MTTSYEVVSQTISRLEGGPPYEPAWIAVEAPTGMFVVNYYGDIEGTRLLGRIFGTDPRLVTDAGGKITAVEFRQNIYDPPNENNGQDYEVFVVCVEE